MRNNSLTLLCYQYFSAHGTETKIGAVFMSAFLSSFLQQYFEPFLKRMMVCWLFLPVFTHVKRSPNSYSRCSLCAFTTSRSLPRNHRPASSSESAAISMSLVARARAAAPAPRSLRRLMRAPLCR